MSQKNTQQRTQIFHAAWLVAGVLQLISLAGCAQGTSPAQNNNGDSLLSSASGGEAAQPSAGQVQASQLPVRVSRTFFDQDVQGSVSVSGLAPTTGQANWSENGDVSVDHDGCVGFSAASGVALCFHLMDDVDSFGLNARESDATGLSAYLAATAGQPCPGVAWDVSLQGGARLPETGTSASVNSFSVIYRAQPAAGSQCDVAPIQVALTVSHM